MRHWLRRANGEPLLWLLERDLQNPGVRYFTLLRLLDRSADDSEVQRAQADVMSDGPVPEILAAQHPQGYWVRPGWGYSPKYRGTVWSLISLAQLGADGHDIRVSRAAEYLLENATSPSGAFSVLENRSTAGAIHCLNGNLLAALIGLGWAGDERVQRAIEWEARVITGEGMALASEPDAPLHYYRSGSCGPGFCCSANGHKPCAWGAVKAMAAFSKLPETARTPLVRGAIDAGVAFLLGCDPATADYPRREGTKPSSSWFRFGFPLFYVADVLQNVEALAALGYGQDARLQHAVDYVLDKQDELGRWTMDHSYNGKMWVEIESKGQPSKWMTLRALQVLKAASP